MFVWLLIALFIMHTSCTSCMSCMFSAAAFYTVLLCLSTHWVQKFCVWVIILAVFSNNCTWNVMHDTVVKKKFLHGAYTKTEYYSWPTMIIFGNDHKMHVWQSVILLAVVQVATAGIAEHASVSLVPRLLCGACMGMRLNIRQYIIISP